MSWKEWDQGEVVEAGDFQDYIQDQVVQNYADSAARSTALGTAVAEGMVSYLQDSNSVEVYNGSAWVSVGNDLSSGTAGYTALSNGTAGLSYQPVSHNYIINGAFDIWQRGTSTTDLSFDVFLADRWTTGYNTGGGTRATGTISQQAFTPADLEAVGYGEGEYYWQVDITAVNDSTAGLIRNRIEDVRTLAGQTVTFSFWARTSSATRTLQSRLEQNFGSGGSSAVALTESHSLTSSWQRYEQTVTLGGISGKTIGSGSYLQAMFLDLVDEAGTIDLWGVQLEAGSIATPFKRNANSIAGELAACQRYYWQMDGSAIPSAFGYLRTSTTVRSLIPTPVEMRTAPSISGETDGDAVFILGSAITGASHTVLFSTPQGIHIESNVGGSYSTSNAATTSLPNIKLDAEL